MRNLTAFRALSLALLLGANAGAFAHEGSAYIQGLQDSLLEHAASDFAAGRLIPAGFRNVELRYLGSDNGARSYMLCGQARMGVGATEEWVDFATIKTDPYEQWLGGSAADMCARAAAMSADGDDLSAALKTKLVDTQGAGKP